MEKKYEVWLCYESNGRPDRHIGSFRYEIDAKLCKKYWLKDNPNALIGIGTTHYDDEGFIQWD